MNSETGGEFPAYRNRLFTSLRKEDNSHMIWHKTSFDFELWMEYPPVDDNPCIILKGAADNSR
jgi:hypothetical protein